MLGIRHIAGDLHTAIDGPGVHDHDRLVQAVQQWAVEAEILGVLPQRREVRDVLPFQLYAQDVGDITPAEAVLQVVRYFDSQFGNVFWNKGRRPTYADVGAQLVQAEDVAQGHAGVQDIAKNGDISELFLKMAGDEGFEPPITGPEPVALPLGQSPPGQER